MKTQTQIYKKLVDLALGVKKDLRTKGIIVPVKDSNGNISFNQFTIVKNDWGFSVVDSEKNQLCCQVGLPQTAIVIANGLALGYRLDYELVKQDQQFMNNSFEEQQFSRIVESLQKQQDWDRYDIVNLKLSIAREKAFGAKKNIIAQYDKLCYSR